MNGNHITVKSRNAGFWIKGVIWLILMTGALACALVPVFTDGEMKGGALLSVTGGILFVVAAAMFAMLIKRELNPPAALVLDSHGFRENLHLLGVEVEWTNVSEIEIFGGKKTPMFGVTFENNDIVLEQLRKSARQELLDNLEENLPSLIIEQIEVDMPLTELRELFGKFMRESRSLGEQAPSKPKNNPFTTDDVLRAFGKLPPEQETDDTDDDVIAAAVPEAEEIKEDAAKEYAAAKPVEPEEVEPIRPASIQSRGKSVEPEDLVPRRQGVYADPAAAHESGPITDSESFFRSIQDVINTPIDRSVEQAANEAHENTAPKAEESGAQEEQVIDDDALDAELRRILDAPRATRIAELEKILANKVTYRTDPPADSKPVSGGEE